MDGRTSAIERCLKESKRLAETLLLSPGKFGTNSTNAMEEVLAAARRFKPNFVIVGPEEPLEKGVVDELRRIGIPCIGPTKSLARLESSKAFTRELVSKHRIGGNLEHRVFRSFAGIADYLRELGEYVIKPDGLTGGKGVKISNAHLFTIEDALDYCRQILTEHTAVVVEEKLDGEEFSLQSFCDGRHVAHMPVVQDHKRAYEDDTGPNTGGMGSYSCSNHSLPFLRQSHLDEARRINEDIARALLEDTKEEYKGILYGGFMVTKNGVKLLEYNARFGDPETLNVLSLLRTDFIDICCAILDGTLHKHSVSFDRRATVCKYIVPRGYPEAPVKDALIDISDMPAESDELRIYRAAVREKDKNHLYLTGSRAIAVVGIANTLPEAQAIAEEAAGSIHGPVFHRRDIGTQGLIEKRIAHMKTIEPGESSKLASRAA